MRMRRSLAWLLFPLLAGLLGGSGAATVEERLNAQRTLFLETEKALAAGNRKAFREGLESLTDYPLYSYLVFADLESRLRRADAKEVRAFLEAHGDTPHGQRLHQAWLHRLAREHRWRDLVADFDSRIATTALACHYRHALLRLDRRDEALDGVEHLWLHGRSQPDACDPVFDAWRAADRLTPELAWGRIRLALDAGQPGLARYISRYLPDAEQPWAERWLALHRRPEQAARVDWNAGSHERAGQMLEHAWLRLARQDPERASRLWQNRGSAAGLSDAQNLNVERTIALRLILRQGGDSLEYLADLPETVFDGQLREWHVRAALAAGDWAEVLKATERMDAAQRQDHAWRYWRARALGELGRDAEAAELFEALAGERNFYGFLAADRVERPYRIGHRGLDVSETRIDTLGNRPEFERAREWWALERSIDARREWERAIAGLGREDLKAAAVLAHGWGWHDRAIFAVALAQEFDDIELRFPLAHARLILDQAATQGINPAWALAVARQESAFMVDARSHAGALGLMQVMPTTGRNMAPHAKVRLNHAHDLLRPEVNVPIGTYYLRRNLDRFGGHPILSTAAYNAGAHRVDSWLPKNGEMPADVWAELIPFPETRAYVRRVLAYQVIYEMRLGLTPTTLSSLLPPITPRPDLEAARMAHTLDWNGRNGGGMALTQVCDAPGYVENPCS
ncbi:lytic murein transglycosylase [Thioalkalivibrio denitrificans]|uniref:Lytic murein transglycosylase n=1 Tax=Thioalkalivibrio denitrificans TaxID=108003 RepID=A0A1V3NKI9_9GAMM|nr:transglycosylase SLT domain-containing protein [Thioalkalivibrio denitrificans]OOG25570.1 lytic murein transglycosylase [Thioalkalivibrio denitrificans]